MPTSTMTPAVATACPVCGCSRVPEPDDPCPACGLVWEPEERRRPLDVAATPAGGDAPVLVRIRAWTDDRAVLRGYRENPIGDGVEVVVPPHPAGVIIGLFSGGPALAMSLVGLALWGAELCAPWARLGAWRVAVSCACMLVSAGGLLFGAAMLYVALAVATSHLVFVADRVALRLRRPFRFGRKREMQVAAHSIRALVLRRNRNDTRDVWAIQRTGTAIQLIAGLWPREATALRAALARALAVDPEAGAT